MSNKQLTPEQYTQTLLKEEHHAHMCADESMSSDVLSFMAAMDQHPGLLRDHVDTLAKDGKLAYQLIFGDGQGSRKGETVELKEAMDAYAAAPSLENLRDVVDAGLDTIYVVLWTLHKFGIPVHDCWRIVQAANMAKLGPDGKPIKDPETGKVKKPAGWEPPEEALLIAMFERMDHQQSVTLVPGQQEDL